MKIVLAAIICCGFYVQAFSQGSHLVVLDTRNNNDVPTFFKRQLSVDFKHTDVVGAPGSSIFTTLLTVAPWQDYSGGKNHQIGFNNDGLYYRTGSHESPSWDAWRKMVVEDSQGSVGIGTSSPLARLDVRGGLSRNHYGISIPTVNIFSDQSPAVDVGAAVALGGKTGNENPNYPFAYIFGGKETSTPSNYAGYFSIHTVSPGTSYGEMNSANYERLRITSIGNVGIGTTTPTEKLAVNGKIRAKEIKVETANWPDYVFDSGYDLSPLSETEKFIKDKGHLPEVPSAKEAETNGVELGEMNKMLLKKIEELTLHLIKQEKKQVELEHEVKALKQIIKH